MKRKRRNTLIIQICISVLLLVFLLIQVSPTQLKNIILKIPLFNAIAIAFLLLPSILIRGFRWKLLFDHESCKIRLFESIQLLFVGLFLNLFLPASSGDIIKSYFGYRWSGIKERMLSISILDKLIALGSIAILGIPFGAYRKDFIYVLLSLLVLILVLLLLLTGRYYSKHRIVQGCPENLNRWTWNKIDFLTVLEQAQVSHGKLFWAAVVSVPAWLITYLQLYCCFHAINADVSVTFVLTVSPLITLARLFPFALGGLGSDEMVLHYLFQTQGITLEQTLTAALLFRCIVIILPGVFGFLFFLQKRRFKILSLRSD